VRYAIPRASRHGQPVTELERFDLGTGDVEEYGGEHGDDLYPDEEGDASQADNRSTQNVED